MIKRTYLLLLFLLFLTRTGQAFTLLESGKHILSLDLYNRLDLINFKNTVDLDSANSDDTSSYLGLDYSFGFKYEGKENTLLAYIRWERNGPTDYDAPIAVHNTLMTSGGVIEEYQNYELLPLLEEFWIEVPLLKSLRAKAGLFAYEVGNGFCLNGAYENYGVSIFSEKEPLSWRLHYFRPDLVSKNTLGPRIHQEAEQGIDYEHGSAHFFAADAKFKLGESSFQPYVGMLADYTSPDKRSNSFAAPISKDLLGTFGGALALEIGDFSWQVEAARNFGGAESSSAEFKDITHAGFMAYSNMDYRIKKITPSLGFLLASGNKVEADAVMNQEGAIPSSRNRAFSYYSPLNLNLGDSICASHADIRPVVAMGSGYGLNYGVPRPSTFAASDFDNIIIASLGADVELTEKLTLGLFGYYLRSFEKGKGTLDGQVKTLPAELGHEVDFTLDYKLNDNILCSLLAGYFFPGAFYTQNRDDSTGSLLTPLVRGDGDADCAYQVELAFELTF